MAKGSSKSTVLKNAQKVAAATTMDSVARNAGKYDAKNRAKQADSQTADKSASGPKHSKKAEKKMSPARKALVVFAVAMLVVLGAAASRLPRPRNPAPNTCPRQRCSMARSTYPE